MARIKDKRVLVIILLAVCAVVASLSMHSAFPVLESNSGIESNLGFLLLINLNIVAMMILGFVVVRNVIRLILDRRENILGARLKTRLVLAFILLSLVPTALLFFVAQGMLEGVFKDWFSPKVEIALDGSKEIANLYYDLLERDIKEKATFIRDKVVRENPKSELEFVDRFEQALFQDYFFYIYDQDKKLLVSRGDTLAALPGPNLSYFDSSSDQGVLVVPESFGNNEVMRGYFVLPFSRSRSLFVISKWVNPKISQAVQKIIIANDDYRDFKLYERPLSSGFFSTLIVVTMLIVFGAISVGFYLARGLTVPIGLLAKGTEQIANGNLNFHIPEFGDDELTTLVRSFNKMTSDLKLTTEELVQRRRYIETVLSNVGVGVLSLDKNGLIATINPSIYTIFELKEDALYLEKSFKEVMPQSFVELLEDILHRSLRGKVDSASRSFIFQAQSEVRNLQIIVTKLYEEKRRDEIGLVILVDDVTELERAQRMSAWQEVAKRIAHEIKNPLTPIQLSVERIGRMKDRLPSDTLSTEDEKLITESVSTISKQVENMRVLVNEFSQFARLPRSNISQGDITQVVESVVESYRSSRPDINIEFHRETTALTLFDAHQIERVVINLIDNAISSLDDQKPLEPRIEVRISEDPSLSVLFVEFKDNGKGVVDSDKGKLFEPYFSKKVGGTGLGLAIVKSVVSDHNGFIRVSDTPGGGLTIRIELPTVSSTAG